MAPLAPPLPAVAKSLFYSAKFISWMQLLLLLLSALVNFAASGSTIKTLPGFPGTLPFKLETGYETVGKSDDVHLFYYFVESENNPTKDPLVLWLSGGPGCSSFFSLAYELGPLWFDTKAFNGSLPSFLLNAYSWTKLANIIFLDAPVGAGFSYATTPEGYHSSDTKSANDIHNFLRKWLMEHPKFMKNPLYLAGHSYAGKLLPPAAVEISKGNEAGNVPHMSLQGYMLGNAAVQFHHDRTAVFSFAHRVGLLSDELYQAAKSSCNSEFVNPTPNNTACNNYLQLMLQVTSKINEPNILEPLCRENQSKGGHLQSQLQNSQCRGPTRVLADIWANDPSVQKALHVRNGTLRDQWKMCRSMEPFVRDVPSVFEDHKLLSEKGYRVLIYSGDHDMLVPYVGSFQWVRSLKLPMDDFWRPWFVDDQVAGYTQRYKNKGNHLTYATIKGAGHTAPEYKPKECFAMIERWFSDQAL